MFFCEKLLLDDGDIGLYVLNIFSLFNCRVGILAYQGAQECAPYLLLITL